MLAYVMVDMIVKQTVACMVIDDSRFWIDLTHYLHVYIKFTQCYHSLEECRIDFSSVLRYCHKECLKGEPINPQLMLRIRLWS